MSNPVSEDREFARMLVDRCDSFIEMFHQNVLDSVGAANENETIDSTEVQNNINTVNMLRNLRAALVEGATVSLFIRHRPALQMVIEMTLDMES